MRTKKLLIIIAVIAVAAVATAVALSACTKDPEPVAGEFVVEKTEISVPTGLNEGALSIEWLTDFVPSKPTAIFFHGVGDYNDITDLVLDESMYTTDSGSDGVVYNSGETIGRLTAKDSAGNEVGRQLAYHWSRNDFNLGVFHYENFADDTPDNVAAKVYSSAAMSYIPASGGNTVTGGLSFNLTEAFVAAWLKTNSAALNTAGSARMMEIRFMGVGTGADLALSAADYLNAMYEQGLIGAEYLPNRIDLINPYLPHNGSNPVVDYRVTTNVPSQLEYSAEVISRLAATGVVFDLVESRPNFYTYNGANYDGVSTQTDGENETEVVFYNEGSARFYRQIMSEVAYLTLRENVTTNSETYLSRFPDTDEGKAMARDRFAADWYLFSITGSDNTGVSAQSSIPYGADDNRRPILDGYNRTGVSASSAVKYGVSAWTPTTYLRAVKGVEYRQMTYSSSTKTETAYVMDKFRTENNQTSTAFYSDTDKLQGVQKVCGYIYLTEDMYNPYVELKRDKRLKDIEVVLEFSSDDDKFTRKVATDATGYYEVDIGIEYVSYSVKITVNFPANKYTKLSASGGSSGSNYTRVTMNGVTSADGITANLNSTKDTKFFIGIYNGGLLEIQR